MAVFQKLVVEPAKAARAAYPSDVTDAQWQRIQPLLATAKGPGRPRQVELREIVNALLYIKQTGCPWRYVPHELPPRSTVHYYFEKWTNDGTLEEVTRQLRETLRQATHRTAQPTAAVIDSQTVKTAEATLAVGWDSAK